MNKKITLIILLAILNLSIISYSISQANSDYENKIIINEIAAFEDSGSEWIEILNLSENAIDLTGWKFFEDSTKHGLSVYSGDLILESGEYAIIADEAETFSINHPEVSGTIIDSSWTSLKESGEEIGLIDSETNYVELFTYIEATNFSLERKNPYSSIYNSENWQEHSNSDSAGYQNSNYSIPATTSNQGESQSETQLEIPNIQDLEISFNGNFININFEFEDEAQNTLILKSVNEIDATVDNGSSYQKGDFLNNAEIISVQSENEFDDYDFEENQKYFYKIFSYDEDFNYSDGINGEITISNITNSGDLIINEFVSSPNDSELEWIELFNTTDNEINLENVYLTDGSNTKHFLSESIDSKNYKIIENLKFALNNSDDTIKLYNNFEQEIYSISYGNTTLSAPAKGQSAGLYDNKFIIFSNPTKGYENKIINNKAKAIIKIQSGSTSGEGSVTINLDGSDSYDIDGDELIYEWDFGDGTKSDKANPNSKTYEKTGEYLISLKVTDIWQETDIDTLEITVKEKSSSNKTKNTNSKNKKSQKSNKESSTNNENKSEEPIIYDDFSSIKITEFMPNPIDSDSGNEWIELYNAGSDTISLNGLLLDDNEDGSSPFDLKNYTIATNSYIVIYSKDSELTLNQSEDKVRLISNNEIIDEVSYTEEAEEGFSYALIDDKWKWLETGSPGYENTINEEYNQESEEMDNDTQSDQNLENLEIKNYSNAIFISEVFPNPSGKDSNQEWIELFNSGDNVANLKDFSLDDSEDGSKKFIFNEGIFIEPYSYFLIYSYDSKINLNNTEDSVRLFNPDKFIADQIYYEEAPENQSFARFDGNFLWTNKPTPNSINILSAENEEDSEKNIQKYQNGNISENIFISEILPNPEGTEVDNEWIEIYNNDNKDINLGNWYLMDNSKSEKKYIFPDTVILKANSYLIIPRKKSKIALDNSKDSLYLYDFDEELKYSVSYEKSIEGESYALVSINEEIDNETKASIVYANDIVENIWTWIEKPTPGNKNPIFDKLEGQIVEKLDNYFYLQTSSGKKIQINFGNLDIESELKKSIFETGTKIELLASSIDKTTFDLKDFTILETEKAQKLESQQNSNLFILITAFIIGLIIGIWRLKDTGKLKQLAQFFAEKL